MRKILRTCLIAISSIIFLHPVAAQRTCTLYWTDNELNVISRSNADGTNIQNIITNESSVVSVRVDAANGKLYWGRNNLKDIKRSNLDGTMEETIVANPNPTGLSVVADIQLDVPNGKIYWSDRGLPRLSAPVIMRANLDGSNQETLITNESALSIDLDLVQQKIYFTTDTNIKRANLDGTMVESIIHEGNRGLFLDTANGKIYWINGNSIIRRANLDGSTIEDLIDQTGFRLNDLTVDVEAGKIYWLNSTTDQILRANLDGTMPEILVPEPTAGPSPNYVGMELVCTTNAVAVPPIPTMSQWGLLIIGLLILNISILALHQKENLA